MTSGLRVVKKSKRFMMTTTTENQHCVAGPCQVNLEALLLKGGCATHSVDFFLYSKSLI